MVETLSNVHFIRPWWLLLAPAVVGIWWLWRKHSDSLHGWRAQVDPDLLKALIVEGRSARFGNSEWWLIGGLLAAVAVAGPTWKLEPSPFAEDAAPLMILLKAGDSMDRKRPAPSPLERARLKIHDLAEVRKGQPLGMIAYAGSAHLVLPPTRDTDVVAQMADEINPAVMPVPGDRLDLALQEAGKLLSEQNTGGTLLVVADSVDGDAQAMIQARQSMGAYPIQFLSLSEADSPEAETITDAARTLNATVQSLSVDESDVTTLAHAAARNALVGVSGKGRQWQEAGYWLVPLIALLVALSFRRETLAPVEESV